MGAPAFLECLPQELIILIIEYVCTMIMQDITSVHFGPSYSFRKRLHDVVHLQMVCRTFYRIIHSAVLVDGLPIRPRLLCLQMDRFRFHLEGCNSCFGKRHSWESPTSNSIRSYCGPVWYNPEFYSVFPKLFDMESCIREDTSAWLMYQAPFWFEKKLVKNKACGYSTLYNTAGNDKITFRPGEFKFPCALPFNAESSYFGTSVVELKSNEYDVHGKDYWLWYLGPHEVSSGTLNISNYLLVDYGEQTVEDFSESKWHIKGDKIFYIEGSNEDL